ncbi:hypothetical protein quinque_015714 [Culex quinquefasciatus]
MVAVAVPVPTVARCEPEQHTAPLGTIRKATVEDLLGQMMRIVPQQPVQNPALRAALNVAQHIIQSLADLAATTTGGTDLEVLCDIFKTCTFTALDTVMASMVTFWGGIREYAASAVACNITASNILRFNGRNSLGEQAFGMAQEAILLANVSVNIAMALESNAIAEAVRSIAENQTSPVNSIVRYPHHHFPDDKLPTPFQMVEYDEYILMYDNRNRVPLYTLEVLTPNSLKCGAGVHRKDCFHNDLYVHPLFRSSSWDYRYTNWERGHIANAGNHPSSQRAKDQTFSMANMAPQCKKLNRRNWKLAETFTRKMAEKAVRVVVVSGPAFTPKGPPGQRKVEYIVLGDNDVAVPPEFFKAIAVFYDDGAVDFCLIEASQLVEGKLNDPDQKTTEPGSSKKNSTLTRHKSLPASPSQNNPITRKPDSALRSNYDANPHKSGSSSGSASAHAAAPPRPVRLETREQTRAVEGVPVQCTKEEIEQKRQEALKRFRERRLGLGKPVFNANAAARKP